MTARRGLTRRTAGFSELAELLARRAALERTRKVQGAVGNIRDLPFVSISGRGGFTNVCPKGAVDQAAHDVSDKCARSLEVRTLTLAGVSASC